MSLNNKNTHKQQGFALIIVIFLIMSIVVTLTSFLYREGTKGYTDFYQSDSSRLELIHQVQSELRNFYINHANDMMQEDLPSYIDEDYIKRSMRIPSNSSSFLRVAISDARDDQGVRWRNLYAWLPATDGLDNSLFEPSQGFSSAFSPGDGVVWSSYSGFDYESERLASASSQLSNIADNMRNMMVANINQDFFRNMNINYMASCEDRPPYADSVPSLECAPRGELVEITTLNVEDAIGLPESSFINPWGNPVRIANAARVDGDGNQIDTPFNIAGRQIFINSQTIPFNALLVSDTPVDGDSVYVVVNQIL